MNNDNIDKNILNIDNIDKKIIENTIEKLQANREYYKLKYLERKSNGYYEEYKKKKYEYEKKYCIEWINKNNFSKIDNKYKL